MVSTAVWLGAGIFGEERRSSGTVKLRVVRNGEPTTIPVELSPGDVIPPATKPQGNVGPSLKGVANRWSEGQLRLRVVDASRLNPQTVMPPYHRIDGLTQVATAFRDRPVLGAEEIEDVVAFLLTLKN